MKVVVLTKSEWPTEWDWVLSRPIITQLYIRERRTLKSVMAIMRTEYAFKATIRMFKSRLALWGLCKYKKTSRSKSLDHLQSRQCIDQSPSLTSRYFAARDDWEYQCPSSSGCAVTKRPHVSMALGDSSVSPELDTQTSEETPTANPVKLTPLGWSVGSPVEDLILATKTYVVGSFEAGAWIITGGDLQSRNTRHGGHTKWLRSKSKAGDVYTLVRHSRELFDHSDLEHGGLFLRRGFSSMGAVLTGEDPFAVWELMNTVSYLHEVSWTEVLHSFLKHLAEISAITHTRFHPIYRMFERLRGLASTEMLHVMASMRQCAAEEVEKFTGPTAISALKLRLGWLRSLSLIQNRESVEDVFGTLLEMSQAQFGQDEVRSLLILNRIGNSLQERHLYDAAEATGREIVSLAKDRSHTEAAIAFRGRGLSLMCRAQVAQGNFHGARASLDELFDFNTAYHGRTDPLTVVTMLMLENCLQASGEDLEAEKIRARRSHFTILMSDL